MDGQSPHTKRAERAVLGLDLSLHAKVGLGSVIEDTEL